MPHLVTSASASVLMLMGCLLGVVFMVRFLVALTRDGKMHSGHAVRPGGLHYAADASRARTRAALCWRIPRPTWRLEWSESPPLSPGIPAASQGRRRGTRCMRRQPAKPVEKLGPHPSVVIARAEAAYESEKPRHARHHFRCTDNCFLSDFHRLCEVLRSHSLR